MRGTPLRGATVLVTGGASGIGRLLCLEAADRGAAAVVVWDRDEPGAEAVAGEISAVGTRAYAVRVDLADGKDVTRAAARTLQLAGRVDVLVNCAGVVSGAAFLDLTEEQVDRTFQVNTLALYRTTRAFLPGMLWRKRGLVVTIASAAGLVGVARQTDYAASKHAAVGFTDSLRAELAGTGVRTLLVCPYYIDTGMFAGVRTRVPALLPILREGEVTRKIWDAAERGAQRLILPPFAQSILFLKGLPITIVDAVVGAFGINHTMDAFTGRPQKR